MGFTATLFDLIRRGVIAAQPVSVELKTWGGVRTEQITDLELSLTGNPVDLRDFEQRVVTVVRRVTKDGPVPLNEFRKKIRKDVTANAATYQTFRKMATKALERSGLLDLSGRPWVVGVGLGLFLLLLLAFIGAIIGNAAFGLDWMPPAIVGAGFVNAAIFGVFVATRKGWVRRTSEGALLAARWEAFRRYLHDFSALEEAPPASLELWDTYLVYAIALGVASDVLEAARLKAPPELSERSNLYPTLVGQRWWRRVLRRWRRWWWRRRRRRLVAAALRGRPGMLEWGRGGEPWLRSPSVPAVGATGTGPVVSIPPVSMRGSGWPTTSHGSRRWRSTPPSTAFPPRRWYGAGPRSLPPASSS